MLIKSNAMALATLILSSLAFNASADELTQDAGSWAHIVAEGSLISIDPRLENVRVWLEGQSRWNDDWNHWYQGVLRAAVGYSLSDRATIWAGYTWVPTQNLGKSPAFQQDVWPGFRYVWPTRIGIFTYRIMVESNFLPGNGNAVRVHPRQMFRLNQHSLGATENVNEHHGAGFPVMLLKHAFEAPQRAPDELHRVIGFEIRPVFAR